MTPDQIPDKGQSLSNMTTRQKVTAGIFIVILLLAIWQIFGLFRGKSNKAVSVPAKQAKAETLMAANAPGNITPQQLIPQPAQAQKQEGMSPREIELMKLQQETQAKYLSALNELQMLKVEREIAETNKAIMSAKLETITAQKGIVDLLTRPQVMPGAYAQGLAGGPAAPPAPPSPPIVAAVEPNYTVVSVSQLQYKWTAVLGYQGNLYNVHVGDVLPPDGSKVVYINRSGVVLEKNGVKKKISLVPII